MICLELFLNFARIAVCTLGGGSATIPFLMELPQKYDWVTTEQLAGIIAVGESAPGPGGVNMASYIGYEAAGIPGVLSAVAGLCLPSIVIVSIIAICLHGFQNRPAVKQFFYGLRPAVDMVRTIPGIAWTSVMVTLVGIGLLSKALVIFISAMVAMVINSYSGIKQTKTVHLWVGQTFGASNWELLTKVAIPPHR